MVEAKLVCHENSMFFATFQKVATLPVPVVGAQELSWDIIDMIRSMFCILRNADLHVIIDY